MDKVYAGVREFVPACRPSQWTPLSRKLPFKLTHPKTSWVKVEWLPNSTASTNFSCTVLVCLESFKVKKARSLLMSSVYMFTDELEVCKQNQFYIFTCITEIFMFSQIFKMSHQYLMFSVKAMICHFLYQSSFRHLINLWKAFLKSSLKMV